MKGNILDVCGLSIADVVVLETDMPQVTHLALTKLLCTMKPGARMVTYANLQSIWVSSDMPFRQLPVNESPQDR